MQHRSSKKRSKRRTKRHDGVADQGDGVVTKLLVHGVIWLLDDETPLVNWGEGTSPLQWSYGPLLITGDGG